MREKWRLLLSLILFGTLSLLWPGGTFAQNYVRTITGSGANAITFPQPVAVDTANSSNVLVGDTANHRIQVFTSTGAYVRTIAGSGGHVVFAPVGVAVDKGNSSNVVEVEPFGNAVQVFTATGTYVTTITGTGINALNV